MKNKEKAALYFEYLEKYAFGDLELFHKLAADAEAKERDLSSSTTSEGTRYHGGSYGAEPYPDFVEERRPLEVVSRATIPFALMMFSCMDVLGYLVRSGDGADNENAHTKTAKNIFVFFKFVNASPTELEIDCLVNIYRHGLGHNYFPKLGYSISYHSHNSKDKLFFLDAVGMRAILNVNRLEYYFRSGFEGIKSSENLYGQISERLEKMNLFYQRKDEQKMLEVIRQLYTSV